MVYTPVGARCRECANLRKLPQYNISAGYLARAAGASVLAGAVVGGLWAVLLGFSAGLLSLLAGLAIGYAVGEAVSYATNRKVGVQLQVIAAGGVVTAFFVRDAVLLSALRDFNVEFTDLLRADSFGWISAIVGVFVAVGRLR
jgi:hypothetical protein